MTSALDGILVLDVGQLVQGPQAAALLTHLGADCIKVELPGIGDLARMIWIAEDDRRSPIFEACNRGKRSLTLDLRKKVGVEVFKQLVTKADVVISNFKAGTMESWGLGYDDLKELNPGLIFASATAFGSQGPDAFREGADIAAQAEGGLISTIGSKSDAATPVGVTIADHIGAMNLAAGVLAALVSRDRTGRGQAVEVSLLGGQIWAQAPELSYLLMTGNEVGPGLSGHQMIRGVYGVYQTADSEIAIAGIPVDRVDEFLSAINETELKHHPDFHRVLFSDAANDTINEVIRPAFRRRTTEQWCEILKPLGVRYALIKSHRQVAEDPGVKQNGYIAEVQGSSRETRRAVLPPISLSETPVIAGADVPALGEHTESVLQELGIARPIIDALLADQVV